MVSSPMTTRVWLADSSNYTRGRGGYNVNGIVIHHAVTTNINVIGQVFSQPGRGGSAHYGVGGKEVHQYVDETDCAWHCLPTDITEVMTPYGFVPLSQIEVGDAVYQWDKDTGEITVGNVEQIVKPRIETVFRMRDTEATAEHKIAFHTYKDPTVQVGKWGEKLNTQFYFPDEFYYDGEGIDLTDDQIRFLVAVQADGSYIRNQESVSFHFHKERKTGRLINLIEKLGLDYHLYHQATGTRIIIDDIVSFCEQYLEEKQFSYKLLDMSREQLEVFVSELPYWDGTKSDKTTFYCSSDSLSAEVAQIAIFLSGRQSNASDRVQLGKKVNTRITLSKNNKYMFDKVTDTTSRETTVSCISVPTGFIIIRQYGRVQIIGNCSNYWGNQNTIGIETVNSSLGGDYPVSDETLDTLIKLVADIARRYNLGKLYVNPSEDCPKISGHRDWQGAQTYCMPLDATEVLTDKGFVSLGNVTKEDKVAQWDKDTFEITFANPVDIIESYTDKVKMIRDTELTEDHRVFTKEIEAHRNENRGKWTGKYVEKRWGDSDRFTFPTEANYKGKGLDLTLDELEYLMWVQADGHYMVDENCLYGVEFHFAKQRKIDRVTGLLEDLGKDYAYTEQSDGTVKIRVYGKEEVVWCERYLNDKELTWAWLELSDEQYKRFREVLVLADGCEANSSYSSSSLTNIAIAQAILQLHGQPSHIYYGDQYPRLYFGNHTYSLDGRSGVHTRETEVGCLTMPKGTIVVRQYGRIQIVGNCPGDYLYARLQYIADRANDINFPPAPAVRWVDVPETTLRIKDGGTDLVDVTNGNVVKHIDGDFTFVQRTDDGKYVRTQYSKEKGINNGVLYSDLVQPQPEPTPQPEPDPTPEPQPDPQPEPTPEPEPSDDTPNWFIRFIHALGEFFINLFTKKED